MAVAGQTPTEVHLNSTTPATPSGDATVQFQAGSAYPDPNNPGLSVRDVSAYIAPVTGDSGTGGAPGVVPTPPAGSASAGKYLKADGTWEVPPGGSGGGALPPYTGRKGDGSTGDVISATGALSYTNGGPSSLSFWFKPAAQPATSGGSIIAGLFTLLSGNSCPVIMFSWNESYGNIGQATAYFWSYNSSSQVWGVQGITIPSSYWAGMVNAWNHIAIIRSGSSNNAETYSIYLNGTLVSTLTPSGWHNAGGMGGNATLCALAGWGIDASSGPTYFSSDAIGELACYTNYALTSTDVANLDSGQPATLVEASNLGAYWKFEALSPEPDLSGNAITGTVTDTSMVSGPPVAWVDLVDSVFGRIGAITAQSGDYSVAQVTNAASKAAVQDNSYTYAADTGSANAYAVSLSPAPTVQAGLEIVFKAAHTNTTTSTLAVNGGSAVAIYKLNGSTALAGGDITAGQIVTVIFDGTYYQLQSPPGTVTSVGGTVTSVGFDGDGTVLSSTESGPVTSSGVLSASLKSQNANTVLAGPASGAAAAPTFRAVAEADISLSNVTTDNVSTSAHGFCPILPNDSTKYLNGVGSWAKPSGGGGSMPNIPYLVQAAEGYTSTSLAFTNSVTSGNTIIAAVSWVGSNDVTVTDNIGSTTWTKIYSEFGSSGDCNISLWYGVLSKSGADTVSFSSSGATYTGMIIAEFANVSSTVDASAKGGSGTYNTSITTTATFDLVVAACAGNHSSNTITLAWNTGIPGYGYPWVMIQYYWNNDALALAFIPICPYIGTIYTNFYFSVGATDNSHVILAALTHS